MKCANKKLTFSYLWPNVNFLLGQQCTPGASNCNQKCSAVYRTHQGVSLHFTVSNLVETLENAISNLVETLENAISNLVETLENAVLNLVGMG